MDVGEWLKGLGLEHYEAAFRENKIDADLLTRLTADDLKDIGVSAVGDRRRLLDAIAPLAGATPAEASRLAPQSAQPDPFDAARAQSGRGRGRVALARPVALRHAWDDIVLPPNPLTQLREICHRATLRHVVHGRWGFDRKLSTTAGVTALFSGPSGTGKTMAAEIVAAELGRDLYKVDLSHIVSKYIGETEKNLDRIFAAAESANAILFFDEADALFGKRSEVKDAHDRYANIEAGYLLQRMDEYEGVAILATNVRQRMDEAFISRFNIVIEFPLPDESERRRIWSMIFPREAPLAPGVDFGWLAREVRLSGGKIRNIAVSAAFQAASGDGVIGMGELIEAARREYERSGQSWPPTDWALEERARGSSP